SVRAKASARSGLHPLEKMPAFLRSVSKFFDTLKPPGDPLGSPGGSILPPSVRQIFYSTSSGR
ncbi:MAG: hypothetical protein KH704_13400, partial [Clostridiales bacterium]|nr:hypothetical protein [Clostridiales bacterium]